MKSNSLKLLAVFIVIVLIQSCSSNNSDTGFSEEKTENIEQSIIKDEKDNNKKNGTLDSLNSVYKKYGYKDICELSADLDSLMLVADYMALICLGETFDKTFYTYRDKLENEKVNKYYGLYNLNRKKVQSDLIEIAMIFPNPCEEYKSKRYNSDKSKIRNDISGEIEKEALLKCKNH